MKTLIIYFSQTGYTRKVAEFIRDGIVVAKARCDLVKLSEVDASTLADYDLVGLGSPVFYHQEPLNVRWFIEGLPELKNKRWFVFCSHGCLMGITLEAMAGGLQKKGINIVGYHDTYADATSPFIPYPTLTTGHPDELDYKEALAFGKEIVERSRRIAAGEPVAVHKPDPVSLKWRLRAEMMSPFVMRQYLPRLRIDMLKCVLCHTCEKNCPAGGIDVEANPPRIQDPCIYCWRCVMVCPEVAIDAENSDWGVLYKTLPDIYSQFRGMLDREVARGKFRWLTDPDAMDFENTQLMQRRRKLT